MTIDLLYLFFSAVTVIGLIQWGKALALAVRKGGWSWLTPASIPFIALFVCTFLGGGLGAIATNAGIVWALVQLCWDLILKGVYSIISALIQRLGGKPGDLIPGVLVSTMGEGPIPPPTEATPTSSAKALS